MRHLVCVPTVQETGTADFATDVYALYIRLGRGEHSRVEVLPDENRGFDRHPGPTATPPDRTGTHPSAYHRRGHHSWAGGRLPRFTTFHVKH